MYFGVIILLLTSLLMVFIFTSNAITTMNTFLKEEAENAYQLSMYTNCSFAVLMLVFVTLLRCVSPQKSKDTNLLLSLPVPRKSIVISKNVYNYIFDLSLFIVILFPGFIVYQVMAPYVESGMMIRGILLILLLPLFSNAISCFIGEFFSKISKKVKHYSVFQAIFSFILIITYLVFNYSFQYYLQTIEGTVDEIKSKIWLIKIMLDYILDNNWIFFIVFAFISIVLYVLSIVFLSSRLGKSINNESLKQTKNTYVKRGVLQSLVNKELKQYFSIPSYILNTAIPGILYLGMSVAVTVIGYDSTFLFLRSIPFLKGNEVLVLAMLFCVLISFFVTTGSSISLEGNKMWILLSSPIKPKQIFLSKILTNLILTGTVILLSLPFMAFFIDIKNLWIFLSLPILSTITSTILGLIVNLKFPKLTWDREETVIKQSLSSLLSLTLPLFIIVVPFVVIIVFSLKMPLYLISLYIALYLIIVILLEIIWLKYKGEKHLKKASLT